MKTYKVLGSIDGSPNVALLFSTRNRTKALKVYGLLRRLEDLQFPETKALEQEFDDLYLKLQEEYGIDLFGEEEGCYCDFDVGGLFVCQELDTKEECEK